ncbi:MAG: hypothetical protein DRP09_15765 [Candidatus Thorarchaeota archaeon]|nr:MAG: hypothetical protein DRP09_15765 [Candidatus Thorarchaeota archaeon]
MRVNKLVFKFGPSTARGPLSIQPGDAVVLVGPNSSGKSLALREIENQIRGGTGEYVIVDELRIEYPSDFERFKNLIFDLNPLVQTNSEETYRVTNPSLRDNPDGTRSVSLTQLQTWYRKLVSDEDDKMIRLNYATLFTLRLDAETRLQLTKPQERGNIRKAPENHLAKLLKNDSLRQEVREACSKAFPDLYFVLDPTNGNSIRILMSKERPANDIEKSLTDAAIDFFDDAIPMNHLGDGVRAYVGIVSSIIAVGQRFTLIDDPEAFLHPPIARLLGRDLVSLAERRQGQVFVATHSADFLQGCLEASSHVNIVRLTYDRTTSAATARELDPTILENLMNNRLLRTTGVFRALFHQGAVIVESEEDKVVYDEINRRLLDENRGVRDVVFLNAQNWQTTRILAEPLRLLGIPAAIILDFDVLLETKEWSNIFKACHIDSRLDAHMNQVRASIKNESIKRGQLKKGGIDVLSQTGEMARHLLENLAEFGVFIVPYGELESWLRSLSIRGKGSKWVRNFFQSVGSTNDSPSFVRPSDDDIWRFLDTIGSWMTNPERKGIPQ